jgi:putative endonuclease
MPYIYVLRSTRTGAFYTGATTDLERRLEQHNSDQSRSTKNRGPWIRVHKEEFRTFAEALRREKVLKTGKGRDEIQRILGQEPGLESAKLFGLSGDNPNTIC